MMGDRPTFPRRNIKGKNFKNTRSSNDGKNTQTERSKVVIRTLPASLRNEDDLKEALGGEWLGKINWIRLIPGSEGKPFMGNGRAYVRLHDAKDIYRLKDFIEKSDHQYFCDSRVSFAPCQRVRSDIGKPNPIEGTLENYEGFKAFCRLLEEQGGQQGGQEILAPKEVKQSEERQSTALMAFLEKRHQGNNKNKGSKKPAKTQGGKQSTKPKDDGAKKDGDTKKAKTSKGKKKSIAEKSKKIVTKANPSVKICATSKEETTHENMPDVDNKVSRTQRKKKSTRKEDQTQSEAIRGGKSSRGKSSRGRGRGRGRGTENVNVLKKAPQDNTQ